mmetsp:Transcript_9122/g.28271  ORF Transcript_9122/g.28271 Transcript_9122/m.28271 type:complete len:255 (-) Transcript_9122:208-972(-)
MPRCCTLSPKPGERPSTVDHTARRQASISFVAKMSSPPSSLPSSSSCTWYIAAGASASQVGCRHQCATIWPREYFSPSAFNSTLSPTQKRGIASHTSSTASIAAKARASQPSTPGPSTQPRSRCANSTRVASPSAPGKQHGQDIADAIPLPRLKMSNLLVFFSALIRSAISFSEPPIDTSVRAASGALAPEVTCPSIVLQRCSASDMSPAAAMAAATASSAESSPAASSAPGAKTSPPLSPEEHSASAVSRYAL